MRELHAEYVILGRSDVGKLNFKEYFFNFVKKNLANFITTIVSKKQNIYSKKLFKYLIYIINLSQCTLNKVIY